MNIKIIGVLLLALMFLASPVTFAQMMGEGMMNDVAGVAERTFRWEIVK